MTNEEIIFKDSEAVAQNKATVFVFLKITPPLWSFCKFPISYKIGAVSSNDSANKHATNLLATRKQVCGICIA